MIEVIDGLYVGDEQSCRRASGEDWRVVHACKHPCHQNAVGYKGSLPQDHPEYLTSKRDGDLYLNIVDMDRELSHEFTEPIVAATLEFVEEHLGEKQVLIHCNKGQSRSPALAMLYLAKRASEIPDESYADARQEFQDLYPRFQPGQGVDAYLRDYWSALE
ncbi:MULTISPECIES: dual specificity protein phosphatase family protein [Haloferacaceae]|uniref:Dual specificity protein phosphatase family protein n=1 Tax=Halorubrum glutamatedens TaxID=2707018 RepID=A0ABD5QNF1_9EURY|nr:dual specificity protein phosphatase [Halobellus captivus]